MKIRYTVPGIYTCHTLHTYTTLDTRHTYYKLNSAINDKYKWIVVKKTYYAIFSAPNSESERLNDDGPDKLDSL